MSRVTWKKIKEVQKPLWKFELEINDRSDVEAEFGTAYLNDFPKGFDVKEDLHEDLNTCDKCQVIVNTWNELTWQGDCVDSYHKCMGDYDAVCDTCFVELGGE
tara:strand:- start:1175 stop:1483 length:309 start_codon:yes stop_codon:yes gene_type:complete